jgi:hypothetical protein
MKNLSYLKIVTIFAVIALCCPQLFSAPSQFTPRQSGRNPRYQTAEERKQQLKQESTAAAAEIDAAYKKILDYVNAAQKPAKTDIDEAQKTVLKNRKYLPVLEEPQRAAYNVLSAWVYYFDEKNDKALKQASAGQKTSPQNINAFKTHFAISLICADYLALTEAVTDHSINASQEETPNSQTQSYSQPVNDDIQLDVNSVRTGILDKTFDGQLEPLEPNLPSLQTKGRLLCALVWQVDENELDRFAPIEPNEPNIPADANEPQQEPNTSASSEINQPLESQPAEIPTPAVPIYPDVKPIPEFESFTKLQTAFEKDKRVAFVGINLNDPAKKANLLNWLGKNPQKWPTFLPSSGQQYILNSLITAPDKPVLLIVAPDTVIRYAGKVEGFLPQLVIDAIINTLQDSNKPEPNLPPIEYKSPAKPQPQPEQPVKNLNTPAAPAEQQPKNDLQPKLAAPANTNQTVDEDFFDPRAETLLENARAFFKIGSTLPYHTYQKPIDMCRTVMQDYPNTKYAVAAQILLRQVPERFRKQYNLTDEELGL